MKVIFLEGCVGEINKMTKLVASKRGHPKNKGP